MRYHPKNPAFRERDRVKVKESCISEYSHYKIQSDTILVVDYYDTSGKVVCEVSENAIALIKESHLELVGPFYKSK